MAIYSFSGIFYKILSLSLFNISNRSMLYYLRSGLEKGVVSPDKCICSAWALTHHIQVLSWLSGSLELHLIVYYNDYASSSFKNIIITAMTSEYVLIFHPYFNNLIAQVLTKICVFLKAASNTSEVGSATMQNYKLGKFVFIVSWPYFSQF